MTPYGDCPQSFGRLGGNSALYVCAWVHVCVHVCVCVSVYQKEEEREEESEDECHQLWEPG